MCDIARRSLRLTALRTAGRSWQPTRMPVVTLVMFAARAQSRRWAVPGRRPRLGPGPAGSERMAEPSHRGRLRAPSRNGSPWARADDNFADASPNLKVGGGLRPRLGPPSETQSMIGIHTDGAPARRPGDPRDLQISTLRAASRYDLGALPRADFFWL